jgi:hypothetical protein
MEDIPMNTSKLNTLLVLFVLVVLALSLSACGGINDDVKLVDVANDTHDVLHEAVTSEPANFITCQSDKSLADAIRDCVLMP